MQKQLNDRLLSSPSQLNCYLQVMYGNFDAVRSLCFYYGLNLEVGTDCSDLCGWGLASFIFPVADVCCSDQSPYM